MQRKYNELRNNIDVTALHKVNIGILNEDANFVAYRAKIKAVREVSYKGTFNSAANPTIFNIGSFLAQKDKPGLFYTSMNDRKNAVPFAEFKKEMLKKYTEKVASVTKSTIKTFLSGAQLWSSNPNGEIKSEKGTMSNQMKRLTASKDVYARAGAAEEILNTYDRNKLPETSYLYSAIGTKSEDEDLEELRKNIYKKMEKESHEKDNIKFEHLFSILNKDRQNSIEEINKLGEKINSLETVIRDTNNAYSEANVTMVKLLAINPSDFAGSISNDKGEQPKLMATNVNTLVDADEAVNKRLNESKINELTQKTDSLNKGA